MSLPAHPSCRGRHDQAGIPSQSAISRMPQWDSGRHSTGQIVQHHDFYPCAANPCPIMSVDRNITTPYVWNWTMNVQHAFTPNLILGSRYVGNHGSNLTGIRDINQPAWALVGIAATVSACVTNGLNAANCASNGVAEQASEPYATKFPYLSNIFNMGNVYQLQL